MLIRIGANPGPAWMRRLGDGSVSPDELRRKFRRVLLSFVILQATAILVADVAAYRNPGHRGSAYNSATKIGNLPLLSVGGRAHGVIAFGGLATGVVAIGGVAAGVIAYGGLSVGVFSVGGLALAVIAIGGGALGWRALGAVAVGDAAVGAVAIGRCAYAGEGVAFGSQEANGKQKESLFG
ncbi:MAG TPA: hypothetical protein VE077_02205 [Candidatus Methylomirabilis sp.]|nr:hypothetical protein [Candidatus Methylomirabilis sp.]